MDYKEIFKEFGVGAVTGLTKEELNRMIDNMIRFKGQYQDSGFEKKIILEVLKKLTTSDFYFSALDYSKIHYHFEGKGDPEIVEAAKEAVFNHTYKGNIFISLMEEIESSKEQEGEYIKDLLKRVKKLNKEIGLSSEFFDFSENFETTIGENLAITDKGLENIRNSKNMEVLMRDADFRRGVLKYFINCELPEGFLDFIQYYYKFYTTYAVRENLSYHTFLKLYKVIGDYRNQALIPFFNSPDFIYYAEDIVEFFKNETGKDMVFDLDARNVAEEVIDRGKFSSRYYIDFMKFLRRIKKVPKFDKYLHEVPLVVLYTNFCQVKALDLEKPEAVFLNTCKFWDKRVFECGFAEDAYREARILSFDIPDNIPQVKLEALFKISYSLTEEQIKEFLKTKYSGKAIENYYLENSEVLSLKAKMPEVTDEVQIKYRSYFIPKDVKGYIEKQEKFKKYYNTIYRGHSEKSLDFAISLYEAGYHFIDKPDHLAIMDLFEFDVEKSIEAIKKGLVRGVLNHLTPNSFDYWVSNIELANKLYKEGKYWRLKISI